MVETTMVKAEVGERANSFIETVQDEFDMNKTEAASFVLEEVGRAQAFQNEMIATKTVTDEQIECHGVTND